MPTIRQPFNVGQSYALSGTTAAQRHALDGLVIHDEVIELDVAKTYSATTPLTIRLQVRVVRSTDTGLLDFAYRITNALGTPAPLPRAYVVRFAAIHNVHVDFADFRPDGLGTVAPSLFYAAIPPGGQTDPASRIYAFQFDASLAGHAGTRFFFMSTNATQMVANGALFVYETGNEKVPGILQQVPGPAPR